MSKNQSRLVRNDPDPKHKANRLAKKPKVSGKPVCTTCGSLGCSQHDTLISPDDPRWANAVRRVLPPRQAVVPRTIPTPSFDPPSWALQVARTSFSWNREVPPITYVGTSRLCATKAGKRKTLISHQFKIDSGPLPFSEETTFLWHGTALQSATMIVRDQFKPSIYGLLGKGVYLGDLGKARNYVRCGTGGWGVLLYVEAALGNVGLARDLPDYQTTMAYDTIHAPAGGLRGAWGSRIRRGEWCVRDPNRVRVREVHILQDPRR